MVINWWLIDLFFHFISPSTTPFTSNQSFNVFSVGNDVKSRAKQKQLVSMAATSLLWTPTSLTLTLTLNGGRESHKLNANSISFQQQRRFRSKTRICCCNDDTKRQTPQSEAIQVYSQIERSFLFPLLIVIMIRFVLSPIALQFSCCWKLVNLLIVWCFWREDEDCLIVLSCCGFNLILCMIFSILSLI